MSFDFLDDVFLLYFALKAAQGIFERLTFLQSNFCQTRYTPKLVPLGHYKLITNLLLQVKKIAQTFSNFETGRARAPDFRHSFKI